MREQIETGPLGIEAYRIVEVKYKQPHTLFHGIEGSRQIETGEWVKAKKKMVRDGTGPYYLSGFNVLLTRKEMEKYTERFKAPRELRIVKVWVRGVLRVKEHSRANVYLADEMWLDWPQ